MAKFVHFEGACPYCECPLIFDIPSKMGLVFQIDCPNPACRLVLICEGDHLTYKLGEVTGDEEILAEFGMCNWEECIACHKPYYACTGSPLCYECRGEIGSEMRHGTGDKKMLAIIHSALECYLDYGTPRESRCN